MKSESQNLEPRSQLITRYTRVVLRDTKLCVRKFSTCVAEHYMATTALDERIIRFYVGNGGIDSALRAEKQNAQLIDRILSGVVKFPCDLEESWIAGLPQSSRAELTRQLAARYGLAGARLPMLEPHHALADLSDVLRDAGATANALAPCFKTGVLSASNVQQLLRSHDQIQTSITDLMSLHAQVNAALMAHNAKALRAMS